MTLTLELAQRVLNAAFAAGQQQSINLAVVIVDRGGRVMLSGRTSDTGYVNLAVAERKAVAAVNLGAPTHAVLDMIKNDPLLLQSVMNESSFSVLPGGLPLMINGSLAGAVGVAGAHYSQDQAVAERSLEGLF